MTTEHTIEIPALSGLQGRVTLPAPAEFSGAMFDTYRTAADKVDIADWAYRNLFYRALLFIQEHGGWDVMADDGTPLSITQALEWRDYPTEEPFRFMAYVGRQAGNYFRTVTAAPDALPEGWAGGIELPHPDAFNGDMFDTYRQTVEKQDTSKGQPRFLFYTAVKFALAHGKSTLTGPHGYVTLEEMAGWEKNPSKEPMAVMAYLGNAADKHFLEVFDPKK
jgi:hypothetical protein